MDLAPPRGTVDLVPPAADAMLGVYDEAHRAARLFGFRYVETPVFEHTELFERTSGETSDVVTKEMYTFEDQGGRSVTLRPESTAPVVRLYLRHRQDLSAPFRAYYVNQNYRHGRPQAARLREFRVFGVEILGSASPAADVEVVALAERFLRERGLRDVRLYLNSIGDDVCRPAYREQLIAYLEAHRRELDDDCRRRMHTNPLRVFDCKVDGKRRVARRAPLISDHLCEPCAEHFAAVREGLGKSGILFEHDPRLVRGLDYYTRTAFEFVALALDRGETRSPGSTASTVCGGGRYDGLAEILGGPSTPGVGFGMGLDRVLLALDAEGVSPPPARAARCFVVAVGPDARPPADALVRELRDAGVPAERALEDRPLKAQLRMADRAGVAFVAILGERELAEGVVTLRRLADGSQEAVPVDEAASRLAEELEG